MGVKLAVGADNAVAIEVIVRGILAVIVAAVSVFGWYIARSGLIFSRCCLIVFDASCGVKTGRTVQGLVDKVPDIAALELGIFAYEVPVISDDGT